MHHHQPSRSPVDAPDPEAAQVVALPSRAGMGPAFQWLRNSCALDRQQEPAEQHRRFAARAAHNLRTPLAALRLQLEEALTYRDNADPYAALEGALRSAERLEKAVTDLLPSARLDALGEKCENCINLDPTGSSRKHSSLKERGWSTRCER